MPHLFARSAPLLVLLSGCISFQPIGKCSDGCAAGCSQVCLQPACSQDDECFTGQVCQDNRCTSLADAATVAIGGAVTGLMGGELVLSLNTTESLTVTADGAFVFATGARAGDMYTVTILAQPQHQVAPCKTARASSAAAM